ncbi:hypothetical protein OSTOST_08925 [Ostertagia ostertagi]
MVYRISVSMKSRLLTHSKHSPAGFGENEASGYVVIIVSNGKTSECNPPLTADNEFTISEHDWRHLGVRIIYVALRGTPGFNMDNIEQIAEDPANIIPVDDLKTLSTSAADAALMKFPPAA